jgi:outer membrane protein assembly complex protein YaeT
VFRIRAGPRVRVGRSIVEGGRGVPGVRLEDLARPAPGQFYRREKAESARDAMRRRLAGAGHWKAAVELRETYDPGRGRMDIVFQALPGPRMVLEARGSELPARLLAQVRDVVREGGATSDSLEAGAERIESHLRAQGHRDAVVRAITEPRAAGEAVVYELLAGPRAVVAGVELRGADPLLLDGLRTRPGRALVETDLEEDARVIDARLGERGHFEARVETDVADGGGSLPVVFVVRAGPGATIVEHVVLSGLGRTKPVAVEREMALRAGEPFSFERLLESQRRLSGLGIFERVSIAELDPERVRRRDVVVGVQEAPRTAWSWGVGYSEQDRLRGSVEVTRRNLGGLGRTASVFARASFRGTRFLLNVREPWLLGRKLDSFATAFWEEEDRTSFDFNRKGVIGQSAKALDARTSLILRYLYQDTNVFNIEVPIDEIDRQYRTYAVSGPSASVVFDGRDDPLEPRRGVFVGADLQLSLDALGGVSYLRGFFQAASIRRLRADVVLVLSGRAGLASTFGDELPLLPLPERFFAGGDYGPRGFPVDGVGPKIESPSGEVYPTGGNALLLGGAEVRYNVTRAFQLASFLDTGNVYPEAQDIDLSSLRWSAGLGLRYRTPIGPIRLDWGYVLDPQPGDEGRSRFHLSIGHAF